MPLFYKYLAPSGLKALQTMTLIASDPATFNDPFEVRPAVDQERHNYFAGSHESFHGCNSLLGNSSMVGIPVENATGFAEQINQRFRDALSKKYRVLCLSTDPHSVLMWAHYCGSHQGLVLGLDPSIGGFPTGINENGFAIDYPRDQARVKLPLPFYRGISVETYDIRGNISNDPNELVECGGGVCISFSQYRRLFDEASLNCLTTKASEWTYEKEVRHIYELVQHGSQLRQEEDRYFVPIPPAALREIILGWNATFNLADQVIQLLKQGRLGSPRLFYATCHPFRYEVQKHEAEPGYLLDWYRTIRPSL
jgi:hypothetical protein